MPRYVDGFVIPIRKKNLKAYRRMAEVGCEVWMDHGALDYYECVGDDLYNECGQPFPRPYKVRKDETLIFAYIVFKSKADRNRVNRKVMKDARFEPFAKMMAPFDMKRLSYGGFKVLVTK